MKELRKPENLVGLAVLLAMAFLPLLAHWLDDKFLVAFFARVLIYAIAASALNIALGLGGMVSLGHALFLGVGMYSVSLSVHHGLTSGWIHLAWTIGLCAVIGTVTGLVSLRTSGIGFIMITLAFAQMGYFFVIGLKQYGGDDGMSIASGSDFGLWQLTNARSVYLSAWMVLSGLTWWVWRLRLSPFGMILRAGRQNPRRIASVGVALSRYQLCAYVLSAILCGIAGLLLANLNAYASPSSMSWVVSGDLILMVVLGGMGSAFGPVLGAFTFLGMEELLKPLTEHWVMLFGLAIVCLTLMGGTGLMGLLARLLPTRTQTTDVHRSSKAGR